MNWSGRPDSNRGPPAPKAGVLSLGSPSFSISVLKTNELEKYLVVARCTEMWPRMYGVPRIFPILNLRKSRQPAVKLAPVTSGALLAANFRNGLLLWPALVRRARVIRSPHRQHMQLHKGTRQFPIGWHCPSNRRMTLANWAFRASTYA